MLLNFYFIILFCSLFLFCLNIKYIRIISFYCSLSFFLFSLFFFFLFNNFTGVYQFQFFFLWNDYLNIYYSIGIDGISIFLILLTTFLTPLCLLLSWTNISYRLKEFVLCIIFTELFLLHVFTILDLFFFYVFFESILLPMFLIIGFWGSRQRKIHASYQFFLYTLLGSLLMLLAIIYIYIYVGSTDLATIISYKFSDHIQKILWFCFFLSFAVKIPMIPVHIWLPEAHVEAPTAGSVILAGLLLKMGGYAILRFLIPVFKTASFYFIPLILTMSIVAILYSSLTTIRQLDLKKIIAYSSVAHMNYVTIGAFSYNIFGLHGCLYLMLSHGFVSSALFICVGIIYDRYKSRLVRYYGGLTQLMPFLSFFFFMFSLANMSFPGTSSFIGEFFVLLAAFEISPLLCFYACFGMILNGVYVIWLFNRIFFGILNCKNVQLFSDINKREFCILISLFFFVIILGIFPNSILKSNNFIIHFLLENII